MNDETQIRIAYDRLAKAYADEHLHELANKPFDCEVYARFAERTRGGTVCDLGCGPGQVARFLAEQGAQVIGIDLSPQMIAEAHATAPAIDFRVGSMLALALADAALAGVVAAYAIVNLVDADIAQACREIARVLAPGGLAIVSFHIGDETVRPPELWGVPIEMDFYMLDPARVRAHLEAAGLVVDEMLERGPYPNIEYASRRAYVHAHKP
jgi:ubiquinone/menaquinone biosynthesis C-methylase UbiE